MEVQNIRIELISPSPLNPRKTFDEAALEELASNIEKQGLLQPITVRVAKSEDVTDLETGDVTTTPVRMRLFVVSVVSVLYHY